MPSCFITGLHVYDNRGLCACGEKGRPWTSRKEERMEDVMTADNRTNEPTEALARVEEFLDGVHGLSEMNVVRGLRKVIAGEETTFSNEVRLSVYGAPCGHTPPSHYPAGFGKCQPCRYPDIYDEEDYDDESRW